MRSKFETYAIYSGVDDKEQKKVMGAFNSGFFSNYVEGAIAFFISSKGPFEKSLVYIQNLSVLVKTLKGIQVVCDLITERFFRAPGLRTKHFERFYLSFNKQYLYG